MKKIKILLLLLLINFNLGAPFSVKAEEVVTRSSNVQYVQMSVTEYKALQKQALSFDSLVTRVQELEQLYLQIKDIVVAINETIKLVKRILNIPELPRVITDDSTEFKHFTGVTMNPGYLDFAAVLNNSASSFKSEGVKVIDLDIYYNKKLFILDHIESDQLNIANMEKIPLLSSQAASRDRIRIPISDLLNSKLDFKIYLAPLSKTNIRVGDKTKIRVVNYKRTSSNKNKPGVGQILIQGSSGSIEVKSKE